jgi:hypothetical protein
MIEDWKIIRFGKYKSCSIDDLLRENMPYCKWIYEHLEGLKVHDNIVKLLENEFKDNNEEYLTFGKHKNKSISWIRQNDPTYIEYLKNNDYVRTKMSKLYAVL